MKNIFPRVLLLVLMALFVFSINLANLSINESFAQSSTDMPNILFRADWGADESILKWEPEYVHGSTGKSDYKIKKIVLHDTGSKNLTPDPNSSGFYKETVKNIYRYHTLNAPYEDGTTRRGFGDIGYHYLIDPNGNIYQGRRGVNGVVGAQVYGFNQGYIGIALLGTYGSNIGSEYVEHPFTSQMQASLEKLVGWLASVNEIDLTTQSTVCGVNLNKGSVCKSVYGLTTHKELAPTQDPGKAVQAKLPEIRNNASSHKSQYDKYIYQESSGSYVYELKNGVKRAYASVTEFTGFGGQFSKVVSISRNFVNMFASVLTDDIALREGDLARDGGGQVYFFHGGVLRPFKASLGRISQMGFDLGSALSLGFSAINKYGSGNPIEYGPDGDLLRGSGPEVYVVENGKKRWITSAALFNSLGYDWTRIRQTDSVGNYLLGANIALPDGSLMRARNANEVYLIRSGDKYWIKTAEAFKSLALDWTKIMITDDEEISKYPSGVAIASLNDYKNLEAKVNSSDVHTNVTDGVTNPAPAPIPPVSVAPPSTTADIKVRVAIFSLPLGETPVLRDLGNGITEVTSYEDRPAWNPSLNDNQFRGNIEVVPAKDGTKLWVVNELNMEDYLKGIAETLNDDPREYQKAFIVAARSYATAHVNRGGKHAGEQFHLKNTSGDQVYKGYGFEKRAPNMVSAVVATSREVIKYNGAIGWGVYSSDSGGVTKSACTVWGGYFCDPSQAYLGGGVADPEGTLHSTTKISASHGVGISAVGARKMAENGSTYTEILRYYYKGVEVGQN